MLRWPIALLSVTVKFKLSIGYRFNELIFACSFPLLRKEPLGPGARALGFGPQAPCSGYSRPPSFEGSGLEL